ncbi:interleukin-11 receptor subunit alpha [Centroberyx gerrardi]|uniref:interleukin-11 receptor subunit alpha n=1 Tax=Centroberyx gerrardi TaxID=166262 RepID=UPI003AAA82A7
MPGPLSSPVCLTVIWFLSWSLFLGRAQILTNEVSGVQYGRLESNVTLACGTSPVRTPVEWRLNHSSALPWHKVTSDGTLVLLHVDQSAQGNYSCYDNRGLLLHSTKLRLGHPPGLLSVSCRVPNHTLVRCKWVESVKTFLPAEYHASYRGIGQEWKPCVVNAVLQHCDISQPAFWHPAHSLKITETNPLGSTPTNVQIRLHELLKPDPPELVSVQAEVGYPTRLVVSWSYPSSWPIHLAFPLTFEIRYRPAGSTHWSKIECNDSLVKIFDALAGHLHQVQVRAQDGVDTDSQWSEWSTEGQGQPWQAYSTGEPAEEFLPGDLFPDDSFPVNTKPDTSTVKTPNCGVEEECNLGLVILLVLFSVVILTTVLSLILVVWVRQKRRNHENKQELTSMVKMKSMPI